MSFPEIDSGELDKIWRKVEDGGVDAIYYYFPEI